METRPNYVLVGFFTLIAVLAAFGFTYWVSGFGNRAELVPIQFRIPGSASGLTRGSSVLFNGVSVGTVDKVSISPENPLIAIVKARVDKVVPITSSTTAIVGMANLTGSANIELRGGSKNEPNLLVLAEDKGKIPVIITKPSAVSDLIASAQNIFTRTEKVVGDLEQVIGDIRKPIGQTVENISVFSKALADNSGNISAFMKSAGEMSKSLDQVSQRLDSTLASAEGILNAVDTKDVHEIVANANVTVANLKDQVNSLSDVMADIKVGSQAFAQVGKRAEDTLGYVDALVTSVKTEDIQQTIDGIRNAATDISKTAGNVEAIIAAVDPKDVTTTVTNVTTITTDFAKLSEQISGRSDSIDQIISNTQDVTQQLNETSKRVDVIVAAVKPDEISTVITNISSASQKIGETSEKIEALVAAIPADTISAAVSNFNKASEDVVSITSDVAARRNDINQTINDAQQLASRLNQASVRVDGILLKVDNMVSSSSGEGMFDEVSKTMAAYRKVADTLNKNLGVIMNNISKFSSRGLRDLEALIASSRRAVNAIDRAVTNFERNPQSLISGGSNEVPTYKGRNRR